MLGFKAITASVQAKCMFSLEPFAREGYVNAVPDEFHGAGLITRTALLL
jgi:hypothetical protein